MIRIVLLLLTLLAFPGSGAAGGSTPRVAIVDRSPLTVRGTGFAPHERVTVTVRAGRRVVRHATASTAGRFLVRIAVPAKAGCAAVQVLAVGSRGTTASVKVPGIECPQGPIDPGQ